MFLIADSRLRSEGIKAQLAIILIPLGFRCDLSVVFGVAFKSYLHRIAVVVYLALSREKLSLNR